MTFEEIHNRIAAMLARPDLVQRPGLAEGTNATTLKTTIAFTYWIWGAQYSKAITDNIAMTALAVQAVSTYCLYLVQINAAGTVSIKKGTAVATDTAALPSVDIANKAIGAFKVLTSGAVTFTSGTTDLSAAGLTVTFYDFDCGVIRETINEIMHNFETEFNYRHMKVHAQSSLADGDYALNNPVTNYKELINAHIIDSDSYHYKALDRTTQGEAMLAYPHLTDNTGRPLMLSELGTTETSQTPDAQPTLQWLLRPTCDEAYTLDFEAYQYSPDLDGAVYTTNWWTQNHPRILIYGTLFDLMGYMVTNVPEQRLKIWNDNYREAKAYLIQAQKAEKISGSHLNIGRKERTHYNILSDTYQ